jgi:hypothetical protein
METRERGNCFFGIQFNNAIEKQDWDEMPEESVGHDIDHLK